MFVKTIALLCTLLLFAIATHAAEVSGRVLKVLPQFLDQKGQTSLTPSLYDRDAYQSFLKKHPAKISTLRFAIQWKANTGESEPLKIKIELLGAPQKDLPKKTSLELEVRQHHWFSHWAYVSLTEEQYKTLGEVTAWRVTLLDGDKLLAEQKSFLWQPSINQ